jgi:glycosyltransferase involved in cell wall biosynthesis
LKKVLIISYYWPPSSGSGVQRWMYFGKYLPEFGVEPTIITVDDKYASYPAKDLSFEKHVSHLRTFKTKTLEPIRFYSFLKSGKKNKVVPQGNLGSKKKGLIDKMATYVRGNFFIPDARVGWNKYAFQKAAELLQNETFDLVITTGPPQSTHLVGLKLKQKFNIKWIADFRDPWTEVYYNNLFHRTKKNDEKDKNMELSVLQYADHILTIGPSMKELLENKIPSQKSKVHFIYNGFDEELFEGKSKRKYPEFTIAHIGLWSKNQAYKEVIEALKNIANQHVSLSIRFVIAGTVDEDIKQELLAIPCVILDDKGRVSHSEAIQEMLNADLLLNCFALTGNSKILISGKLMEYIASNNPIIIIGNNEGDAANLLKEVPNGYVVAPNDADNLKTLVEKIIFEPKTEVTTYQPEKFSRKNTTKELFDLINLVVAM